MVQMRKLFAHKAQVAAKDTATSECTDSEALDKICICLVLLSQSKIRCWEQDIKESMYIKLHVYIKLVKEWHVCMQIAFMVKAFRC